MNSNPQSPQDPRHRLTPEQMRILDERVAHDIAKWKQRLKLFNLFVVLPVALFIIWYKWFR
jgi:hypothetical protein